MGKMSGFRTQSNTFETIATLTSTHLQSFKEICFPNQNGYEVLHRQSHFFYYICLYANVQQTLGDWGRPSELILLSVFSTDKDRGQGGEYRTGKYPWRNMHPRIWRHDWVLGREGTNGKCSQANRMASFWVR